MASNAGNEDGGKAHDKDGQQQQQQQQPSSSSSRQQGDALSYTRSPPRGAPARGMRVESLLQRRDGDDDDGDDVACCRGVDDDDDVRDGLTADVPSAVVVAASPRCFVAAQLTRPRAPLPHTARSAAALALTSCADNAAETPLGGGDGNDRRTPSTYSMAEVDDAQQRQRRQRQGRELQRRLSSSSPQRHEQQQQQQQQQTPPRRRQQHASGGFARLRSAAVATARALLSTRNGNHSDADASAAPRDAHTSPTRRQRQRQRRREGRGDVTCVRVRASSPAAAAATAASVLQQQPSAAVTRHATAAGGGGGRGHLYAVDDSDMVGDGAQGDGSNNDDDDDHNDVDDDDDADGLRWRRRRCRVVDASDGDRDEHDQHHHHNSSSSARHVARSSSAPHALDDRCDDGSSSNSSSSSRRCSTRPHALSSASTSVMSSSCGTTTTPSSSLTTAPRARCRLGASTALAVFLCISVILIALSSFLPFYLYYNVVVNGLIHTSLSTMIGFASFATSNRFESFTSLVHSLTTNTLLCSQEVDADLCDEYTPLHALKPIAFVLVRFKPTVRLWKMYRSDGFFAEAHYFNNVTLSVAISNTPTPTPYRRIDEQTLMPVAVDDASSMQQYEYSNNSNSDRRSHDDDSAAVPALARFDDLVNPDEPWMRDVYLPQLRDGQRFRSTWLHNPSNVSSGYMFYILPFASRNHTGFCLTAPNMVAIFSAMQPLVPSLREHGRILIVDVLNDVSVYRSWEPAPWMDSHSGNDDDDDGDDDSIVDYLTDAQTGTATTAAADDDDDEAQRSKSVADDSGDMDAMPTAASSVTLNMRIVPVPYDQLSDEMVRTAMAEVQRRGGVRTLMQSHGALRLRHGNSNILLNVTSNADRDNLQFATLIFLLESDFLDNVQQTSAMVLGICVAVVVVATACAFVMAVLAVRTLRRLVPDIQRLSALEIPSSSSLSHANSGAIASTTATLTSMSTTAATPPAHKRRCNNNNNNNNDDGASATCLADEDATRTRRGASGAVVAVLWRGVRVHARRAASAVRRWCRRVWCWLASLQLSYTEMWQVNAACAELRASLRVMKSLMPQAVMTTMSTSDVASEMNETMYAADMAIALHAHVSDGSHAHPRDAYNAATVAEQQRNRRVNTLIFMDKPYVFVRRAFTLVYVTTHNVPSLALRAMLGELIECTLQYSGCVEQLGHNHVLVSFGAHASLPMHAAKGCNFALELYRRHSIYVPGYSAVFVVDTNEYAVGTCGTQKNSARVVLGTNYLVDAARVLYNIHCSIAATPAATSHLPDYQSVPMECIRVDSVNVPLVLCELRPVTAQSDIAQMTADAVHFRAGFFCMRLGMYAHALNHFRAIQSRSDRQAQRLRDVCQQRCAALDSSPYIGLSTNVYFFLPHTRHRNSNSGNNSGSGSGNSNGGGHATRTTSAPRHGSSNNNNNDDDDDDNSGSDDGDGDQSNDSRQRPQEQQQQLGDDDNDDDGVRERRSRGSNGEAGGGGGSGAERYNNNNNNNASTATALFDVICLPSSSREELSDLVDTDSVVPTATVPLTFRDVDGCVWYRSLRSIGEGAFSAVYLGMSEQGRQVAIKCIARCRRDVSEQSVVDELHIAARLKHPNVVSYISCSVTLTHLAIFMEFVPGGSLYAVQRQFGALTEAVVRRFIMDILNGLIYLHKNGVVHCDVKPHNMLLDTNGVCKLSDFGSTIMGSNNNSSHHHHHQQHQQYGAASSMRDVDEPPRVRGTALYMAPEVARGGPCTTPSDIFSFGASLLELLLGRVPWCWTASAPPGSNAASLQRLMRHEMMFVGSLARGEVELHIPDTLGYEAQNVARACCRAVPAERPSAQELMRFPFFT